MLKKILRAPLSEWNYILQPIMSKTITGFLRFMAAIGADSHRVLHNLLAPERPKDKFFENCKVD